MRTDPAGSMSTIFESFKAKIFSDLHVGFLCKVINFDSGKCAADVQPLIRTTSDMPADNSGRPSPCASIIRQRRRAASIQAALKTRRCGLCSLCRSGNQKRFEWIGGRSKHRPTT